MGLHLSEKQKKAVYGIGVAAAVYAGFRFFLPLVLPFFLAYGIALLLRPSAVWLERKTRFTFRGKRLGIPLGVIGGMELLLLLALAVLLSYLGGCRLLAEAEQLLLEFPEYVKRLDIRLTGGCRRAEQYLGVKPGLLTGAVKAGLLQLIESVKTGGLSGLMMNSVAAAGMVIQGGVMVLIVFLSVILTLQEMEELERRRHRSLFHREFFLFGRRFCSATSAWLKTQGILVGLTSCLCIGVFVLTKQPYAVLTGLAVGVFDALPFVGSAMILIPWGLVSLFQGRWFMAALLFLLQSACYFLREFTEARVMGKQVGLSPLETLISMYVGLRLFGVLGFLLGPAGLLILRDFMKEYENERESI